MGILVNSAAAGFEFERGTGNSELMKKTKSFACCSCSTDFETVVD